MHKLAEAIESLAKGDIKSLGLKTRQRLLRTYLHESSLCDYLLSSENKEENDFIRYDIINFVSHGLTYNLTGVGSWLQNRTECNASRLRTTDILWTSTNTGKRDEINPPERETFLNIS